MKYLYSGFGMVMLGLFAFAIVILFQNITINNESDYYNLKEAMRASMVESIDWIYYATGGLDASGNAKIFNGSYNGVPCYGPIKIVEEKFVENFTRRFVKNAMGDSSGYSIEFYDVMEFPAKATIIIKNSTSSLSIAEDDFVIVNNLTGILETFSEDTYSMCNVMN